MHIFFRQLFKRRLSRSDIQYWPYLHILPWEDSVDQIYNTDPIYICFHEKTQSIRYTINAISTYITMRRLSRSGIQYRPYLNKLPWEDSVNQIYNTDHIYIYYHEKTQSSRYTIPTPLKHKVTYTSKKKNFICYDPISFYWCVIGSGVPIIGKI